MTVCFILSYRLGEKPPEISVPKQIFKPCFLSLLTGKTALAKYELEIGQWQTEDLFFLKISASSEFIKLP